MKTLFRLLAIVLLVSVFASLAHAQTANNADSGLPSFIPVQYQVYALAALQITKWLSELYSSVRSGGGLRRIIMSFWFGEQTPKVILDDYKQELSAPPFPKPPTA